MNKSIFFCQIKILEIDSVTAWICPTSNGFYRNPVDSHKYYECVNDYPYEFNCPDNLVFNESIQQCDYTIGPKVEHTTQGPVTVPNGDRVRHTTSPQANNPVTNDQSSVTQNVVTRGRHEHSDQSTQPSNHQHNQR